MPYLLYGVGKGVTSPIIQLETVFAPDLSWWLHDIADRRDAGHRLMVRDMGESNHLGVLDVDEGEWLLLSRAFLLKGLMEDGEDSWDASLKEPLEEEAERFGMTVAQLRANLMGRGGREELCGTWR